MKKILFFLVFIFQLSFPFFLDAQVSAALQPIEKQLAPGLVWKQIKSEKLFDSRQYINILEIDRTYDFKMAYATDTLIRTSDFAKDHQALAAVNGGFFDMKNGGSVTFMKVEGKIVHKTVRRFEDADNEILESALIITKQGKLLIKPTETIDKWKSKKKYASILVTGPLLLLDHKSLPLVDRSFTNTRHPRTCACTTSDQKTLLITVDGRHEEAAGMSLQELTQLSQMLNCKNAVNLDGGGSTTMYIKGQGETGVVNRPSDNKKFDNKGERPCANSILVNKEE